MLQEAPPAPMVGTFEVFRYASGGDIVLMILGFIGALVQGAGKRMRRSCLSKSMDGGSGIFALEDCITMYVFPNVSSTKVFRL